MWMVMEGRGDPVCMYVWLCVCVCVSVSMFECVWVFVARSELSLCQLFFCILHMCGYRYGILPGL